LEKECNYAYVQIVSLNNGFSDDIIENYEFYLNIMYDFGKIVIGSDKNSFCEDMDEALNFINRDI
jgi:hypothetical protein